MPKVPENFSTSDDDCIDVTRWARSLEDGLGFEDDEGKLKEDDDEEEEELEDENDV